MLDHLRALSGRLITRWLHRPRGLVVRAWFCVSTHADDLAESGTNTATDLHRGAGAVIRNNARDTAYLRDAHGNLVDTYGY